MVLKRIGDDSMPVNPYLVFNGDCKEAWNIMQKFLDWGHLKL
jgi:hypothetical protein